MKTPILVIKSVALSLIVVVASVLAVVPIASAASLVTVTPYENLSTTTPTTVTVSATGLLPDSDVAIRQVEMNRVDGAGTQVEQLHKAVVNTGPLGAFVQQVGVQYDVRTDLAFADFCQNSNELGRLCYLQLQYQGGENSGLVISQYKLYFGTSGPVADGSAPTITLNTPADGAAFEQGSEVYAEYTCQDNIGGSGVATCEGSVPTGEPIDTETPGAYTFTVNTTDTAGNPASVTHNYNVTTSVMPPATPISKDDCKGDGWKSFVDKDGKTFKNQGDCIKFVNFRKP